MPGVIQRHGAVADVDALLDGLVADDVLTELERVRRDRLVAPVDRAAYAAAHLLVRVCVAELVGDVDPADVVIEQRCPTCGEPGHGAPSVRGRDDVHVSLAHAGAYVAAVAARMPCGIDVERVAVGRSIPARALTAREQAWVEQQLDPALAFTRLWVRKEALVKAGRASLADAASLDVLGSDGEPANRVGAVDLSEWSAGDAELQIGCTALVR